MFFGVLIITVVYVPILALEGIEGKMFKPMAVVVMLSLGGSLVLALTLMPVLCSYLLGGKIQEKDSRIVSWMKRVYLPLLNFGVRHRWLVVVPMLGLFAFSLVIFTRLGAEFIPPARRGRFSFQLIRSSSAALSSSLSLQQESERVLRLSRNSRNLLADWHGGSRHRPDGAEHRGHVCHAQATRGVAQDRWQDHCQGRSRSPHARHASRPRARVKISWSLNPFSCVSTKSWQAPAPT